MILIRVKWNYTGNHRKSPSDCLAIQLLIAFTWKCRFCQDLIFAKHSTAIVLPLCVECSWCTIIVFLIFVKISFGIPYVMKLPSVRFVSRHPREEFINCPGGSLDLFILYITGGLWDRNRKYLSQVFSCFLFPSTFVLWKMYCYLHRKKLFSMGCSRSHFSKPKPMVMLSGCWCDIGVNALLREATSLSMLSVYRLQAVLFFFWMNGIVGNYEISI